MQRGIQDICKQQGVSLLELADRSGLDLPKVRSIFLGRWTPSPAERKKISEALGVAAEDVAWGHTTPIQHIYGHGPS